MKKCIFYLLLVVLPSLLFAQKKKHTPAPKKVITKSTETTTTPKNKPNEKPTTKEKNKKVVDKNKKEPTTKEKDKKTVDKNKKELTTKEKDKKVIDKNKKDTPTKEKETTTTNSKNKNPIKQDSKITKPIAKKEIVKPVVIPPPVKLIVKKEIVPPVETNLSQGLTFETTQYSYGEIEYNANGTCTISCTNNTQEPLFIKDTKTTCGCTTPLVSKRIIAPGETEKVNIKYDTAKVGTFNKEVTLIVQSTISKKKISQTLSINGRVKPLESQE